MKILCRVLPAGSAAVAAILASVTVANAAVISFSSDVFDNVTDVSTNGTLVTAVNLGQGDDTGGVNSGTPTTPVTVNGVTFGADSGDGVGFFVVSSGPAGVGEFRAGDGNDFRGANIYDSTANPITGLAAAEAEALLQSVEFGAGVGNSIAQLTGLTIGQAYELQILLSRTGDTTFSVGYATPSGDATKVFPLTGVAGQPPSIVTGTFIADETVQDIHIATSGAQNLEASAFQLRAVTELQLPTLTVDKVTGNVTMTNNLPTAIDIDFYQIASEAGALNPSGWNSIESTGQNGLPQSDGSGNGWEELGTPNNNLLAEGYLQGSSLIGSGESLNLGQAYDPSVFGGDDGDLQFVVGLSDGSDIAGFVSFVVSPAVPGDYNGDGIVNAAAVVIAW